MCFSCLPNTWRQLTTAEPDNVSVVSKGELLAYLNPVPAEESASDGGRANYQQSQRTQPKKHRVVDREDLQPLIPGFPTELA